MKNRIKLVIFDLDDTLTTGPTIWELIHKEMRTWKSHGIRYWQEFLKGDFGFNAFIKKDVACWKGMSMARVRKAIKKIKYVPQIKKTLQALRKPGVKVALISSGLELLAQDVSTRFGVDHIHANTLEVQHGKLTGNVKMWVTGLGKGRVVRNLRKRLKIKKSETLAVGDSRFDIPMFKEAGTRVTFTDAKSEVKKCASYIIPKNNLYRLINIVEQASD